MRKLTTEEFIEKAKKIHGEYFDYSISEYIASLEYIEIICPTHGTFTTKPNWHLNGQGCRKCSDEIKFQKRRLSTDDFIMKAKKTHGNTYDYSTTVYKNCRTKVKIQCKKHGEFKQTPKHHINGSGCPICKSSKGEILIENYLNKIGIKHVREHKFDGCRNQKILPFDFYLPKHNICIEYDGRQHYEVIEHFGGVENYEYTKNNDKIKTQFCVKNNIKLVRISYKDDILKKLLVLGLQPII